MGCAFFDDLLKPCSLLSRNLHGTAISMIESTSLEDLPTVNKVYQGSKEDLRSLIKVGSWSVLKWVWSTIDTTRTS